MNMRLKSALMCAASLYLFVVNPAVAAPSSNDRCGFPPDLRDEISNKYPGTRVVSAADLSEYKRKLFQKDHGARCPGLVNVNFYGDGKPTYALVLIAGENPKRRAELIVAHQVTGGWEIRSLDVTDGTPVVWREAPGKYDGLYYGEKTIHATRPVIVFCGLESWAVVYAWNGKEVEKVQISD
jgi:hypothetical protein